MRSILDWLRVTALAALAVLTLSGIATAIQLWNSSQGDINFAGLTTTTIDNMAIGGTTPAAGSFTTVRSTGCVDTATVNPTTATDLPFYTATRAVQVVSASQVHAVAAGGASTLQITKDTGTTAPGAGTDLLTSTGFNLNATANTVQVGTLTATTADLVLAAGDRLSIDFANAIQSSAGINVTVCLALR